MKGEKTLFLLRLIAKEMEEIMDDVAEFTILPGTISARTLYQSPFMREELMRRHRQRRERKWRDVNEYYRFRMMLSRLKKEGLIKREKIGNQIRWILTGRGLKKQEQLEALADERMLPPVTSYSGQKTNETILVIFDIPEKQKYKREWLRYVLESLGFSQLQKSVWNANIQLPGNLMEDLNKLGLLPYVHIFSVHKKGTLLSS